MIARRAFFSALIVCVVTSSSYAASSPELRIMTEARTYFAKGDLNKAYSLYNRIPKSSDYWLEAMEEKAHVRGRKGDFAGTISLLQTPLSSAFVGLTGPEPYFVMALTHLKICDYSAIFKVTKLFKDRFSDRVAVLTNLEKKGESEAVSSLLVRLETKPLNFKTIGALAKDLPRNLQRDKILSQLALEKKSIDRDAAIKSRLQMLANIELQEIENIINKLQVVEAEVIHRVYLADLKKSNREKQGKITAGKNQLNFPYTGEVWLDELDNYAARVEKCPTQTSQADL